MLDAPSKLTADVIKGFSQSLLQKNFDAASASPEAHYEWWKLFCSKHPQVAISAPRNHAKSTALTYSYTLACVLFRERSYVLIVSDTVSQASQFLSDIKATLAENEQIRSLFKVKEFLKDTEDDIIVACEDGHMFRIQAKGAEQKLRGLKWNNKRPDLIVCDDLENDEIVMNKERREKFRRWFYGALLPCKSVTGIIRYVGTILHSDSMLESIMPKTWQKHVVTEPLKIYTNKRLPWLSVKYRAHTDDFEHILWPQRYSKEYFLDKKSEYYEQGIPDVYSMEYLNIPIDESVAFFKRKDFLPMDKEDLERKMHYYITADLAISQEETADYSVFVVAGVDENRTIHIKDVIRERLDGREIVDTILALESIYEPEAIGIEEMQVSKAIGPFLREEMVRQGIFPTLVQLKHKGKDKMARARSIQARMRANAVKFNKEGDFYPDFENELCTFPRSKHDDQVDSFAYLGMLLDILVEAPTKEQEEEEQYLDEYERNIGDAGRSAICGY
jgi:predicted phage terminase large subunit-like protein